MGDRHAENLKPKLKELSEKEKRNILVLHQSNVIDIDEDDYYISSFLYEYSHFIKN